jgi:hypothetical protein
MKSLKPPSSATDAGAFFSSRNSNGFFKTSPHNTMIKKHRERRTIMHKTMLNDALAETGNSKGLSLSPLKAKFYSRDFDEQ